MNKIIQQYVRGQNVTRTVLYYNMHSLTSSVTKLDCICMRVCVM